MPNLNDRRTITFEVRWFLTNIGVIVTALFAGFWVFHSFTVSDIRSQANQEIERETARSRAALAQAHTTNTALQEAARRESEAKAETTRIESQAKIRELEIRGENSLTQLENQSRREKEELGQIIEGLRQKLSLSRSSLEISASGDFLSTNALLIDEQSGREILAAGDFVNSKRLLLPEYTHIGWRRIESVSLAQIDSFLHEQTIKFRPEEVSEDHIDWIPLFTVWAKDNKHAVGIVGAAQLSKAEYVTYLQRGSTITTKLVTTNDAGEKIESVETVQFDGDKLARIPVGMSAYGILFSLVFQNDPLSAANVEISSFSARGDALHFAGTVTDSLTQKKHNAELLVMQDADDIFFFFNAHSSENALDPVSREATDWLRASRIIKVNEPK